MPLPWRPAKTVAQPVDSTPKRKYLQIDDLFNCDVKMPRPFNPHQLASASSSRRGQHYHRGDSTPKSVPVGPRRGETPGNSRSSSRAFSTPKLSPQKILSPEEDGRRNVRRESPFVLNQPIPEPRAEPIELLHAHSESNDAADAILEGRSIDGMADGENETIMAIDMREQQTIGCAYYTACEEKLYLMQDCKFADLTLFDTRTPVPIAKGQLMCASQTPHCPHNCHCPVENRCQCI
jgi:hypothetical protein